jgi:molecular chaperone GrpE
MSQPEREQPLRKDISQYTTLEDCREALTGAMEQLAEYEDKYLRTAAALENTRKQADRNAQVRNLQRLRDFGAQLLEVTDNLERALEHGNPDDPLYEGVRFTLRQFYDTLEREGITPINVQPGALFNPHLHEAVETEDVDIPDVRVTLVRQRGYTFEGQVLRPARVVVGR